MSISKVQSLEVLVSVNALNTSCLGAPPPRLTTTPGPETVTSAAMRSGVSSGVVPTVLVLTLRMDKDEPDPCSVGTRVVLGATSRNVASTESNTISQLLELHAKLVKSTVSPGEGLEPGLVWKSTGPTFVPTPDKTLPPEPDIKLDPTSVIALGDRVTGPDNRRVPPWPPAEKHSTAPPNQQNRRINIALVCTQKVETSRNPITNLASTIKKETNRNPSPVTRQETGTKEAHCSALAQ